jgi:tight adherence protein C
MGFAIFTFCCVFLLIASAGALLFYRAVMVKRISGIVTQRKQQRSLAATLQQTGTSLGVMVEKFEKVVPKTQAEVGVVQQRLIRAGFRKDSAVSLFYGTKVLVIVALVATVVLTGLGQQSPFVMYAAALGIGYLAPDFWLGKKISARQKKIKLGLPDVLDLLVICAEGGLSLDGALSRVSREFRRFLPEMADELGLTAIELGFLPQRRDALDNLAKRVDIPGMHSLTHTLIQTERYGTPLAQSLRALSTELREERMLKAEEKAAKLPATMTVPMIIFILPATFIILVGPAAINVFRVMHQ